VHTRLIRRKSATVRSISPFHEAALVGDDDAVMARRPEYLKNDSLTAEELQQLRHNLLLLSPYLMLEK